MKFSTFVLMTLTALVSAPAMAEDFYVELGRAPNETEGQAMWATLQPQHKTLAKYSYFPNQLLQPDGSFIIRVQAGPMHTKEEAQRVCYRLFRKQASCFVIEGFDPNNAKTFDKPKEVSGGLSDFLPWRSAGSKPAIIEAAPLPAPTPVPVKDKGKAKVDVAEAIPVPISESNEVTVGEPVAITATEDAPTIQIADVKPTENAGWLSIQPFLDQKSAQKFWSDARRNTPEQSKDLSMKIIHPLVSHDIPKVILALGSFPSESAAMKFCKESISQSAYLECNFSTQPPQGEEAEKPAAAAPVAEAAPTEDYTLTWVQVLSETTQDKALEKWERIRTDNDDLLADIRSQITTSLANPGVYVVRIGPLKTRSKAAKLCDALKANKVACTLVSL